MLLAKSGKLAVWSVVVLCLVLGVSNAMTAPISGEYVPGQIIVKYVPGTTSGEISALSGQLNSVPLQPFTRIGASLQQLTSMTVPEAIALLGADPRVEYIEPNYVYHLNVVPDDPDFDNLWAMENTGQTGGTPDADIDAPEAWDVFTGSTNVLVGVIDTGVDYNHPDLVANIWTNPGEIAGNGIDDDGNGYVDDIHGWDFANNDNDPMDDHSHGTHVSGTIGGVGNNGLGVAGVNWHVRIMALKFLDAGGNGTAAGAIACVEYATMMGVDLTSNSWGGGGYSEALEAAIDDARTAGILFVAAAGNSGLDNDASPHYPSSYPLDNIIAVGATDPNDDRVQVGNWASNYGLTTVDVGAPGLDIYSTLPGGTYGYKSGTSMATPHVSGVVAMIKGQFPNISGPAARTLLLNSADVLPQLSGWWATGGRINAARAMAGPDSIPPSPVVDLAVAEVASNRVALVWTATGDDGNTGTANSYELRYATYPLNDATFDSATAVVHVPDPGPSGQAETLEVSGLAVLTTYYFALRVRDEYDNPSPLSNLASTTTLGPPTVAVTPSALTASLITGGQQDQTLTIFNTGAGVLDFNVRTIATDGPAQAMQVAAAAVVDGLTPSGMAYVEDLPLPVLSADEVSLLRSRMGAYAQAVSFNTAGALPVIGVGGSFSADLLYFLLADPQLTSLYTFVEVDYAADDLSDLDGLLLAEGDNNIDSVKATVIRDFFDSGRGVFIGMDDFDAIWSPPVSELLAPVFGISGAYDADFCSAAELNPNHPINQGIPEFVLGGAWCNENDAVALAGADWLFRDSSQGGVFGVAYEGRARSVLMGEGLSFIWEANQQLNSNAVQWIMSGAGVPIVSPGSGAIAAGGSLDVVVSYDAASLCGGDYFADVLVISNDPVTPELSVPSVLTVSGVPDIAVADSLLDFGPVFVGNSQLDTVVVSNPGCDVINVTSVSTTHPDFNTDLSPFSLQVGESRAMAVAYVPSQVGSVVAALELSSNDPDQPLISVALQAAGLLPPVISVTPGALSAGLVTGGQDSQLLTVRNTGANDLIYKVGSEDLTAQGATVQISRGRVINAAAAAAAMSASTSGGSNWTTGSAPLRDPLPVPTVTMPGLLNTSMAILLVSTGSPTEIQAQLLAFADVAIVDIYDAQSSTPSLADLEAYHAVILSNSSSFFDPTGLGDVLADYIDGGGGVVQTLASFVTGYEVGGRFQSGGYAAFAGGVGPLSDSSLASFDASHPIMAGVTAVGGGVLASAPLVAGAQWVADWAFGEPFVATQGSGVVGVNIYVAESGYWSGDLPLVLHNAALWASGSARWLRIDPRQGTVPAGSAQDLLVTFDAKGVCSGTYNGNLLLRSNDPVTPVLAVPAAMVVTGEPDITVSTLSLPYGSQFIGAVIPDTLTITNDGCDVLSLTPAVDNGEFSIATTPIDIPVGESRYLEVVYSPTSTGLVTGTLRLNSNDPDEALVEIALTGTGLVAPVIAASPTSFASDLVTGALDTQMLTLSNTGGNDLLFDISVVDVTAAGTSVHVSRSRSLPATSGLAAAKTYQPGPAVTDGVPRVRDPLPVPGTTVPGTSAFELSVLIVGNGDMAEIQTRLLAFADITAVDVFDTDNGTPTLAELMAYPAVLLANNHSFSDPVALGDVLADYVDQGFGVVQTEASFTTSWQLAGRFRDEGYGAFDLGTGPLPGTVSLASLDANHPIMSDVAAVTNSLSVTAPLAPGAVWVAEWDNGEPFVATQGDLVVGVNGFVAAPGYWTGDMPLVLHNALAWVGGAAKWLDVDPVAGVVGAGQALDLLVTLDARDVCGGTYLADILVDSNDPLTPQLVLPATMTVTGEPDIAVSDTLLAFGQQFVGAMVPDSVVVSNPGCGLLVLNSIAVDNTDFIVDASPFVLAVGESRAIAVTFNPSGLGPITGRLSLNSNDPDQVLVQVALSGEGSAPPVMSVTPGSLDVTLLTDEVSVRQLTLANSGGSDLTWSMRALERDSLSAAMRAAATTAVAGLVPTIAVDETGEAQATLSAADHLLLNDRLLTYQHLVATVDAAGARPTIGVSGSFAASLMALVLGNPELASLYNFIQVAYEVDDLTGLDGLLLAESDANLNLAKAAVIRDFYDSGRGVFIGMDDFDSIWSPPISDVLAPVFGISGAMDADFCGNGMLNSNHPINDGIAEFIVGGSWCNENDRVMPDSAEWLFMDSSSGNVFGVANEGTARTVLMGESLGSIWLANEQLNVNAVNWLMQGAGLPTVEPAHGVVPAGESRTVDVTFSAAGLCGGDVLADLVISSDDPQALAVTVPADMHVVGAPVISVVDSVLAFGNVFVGYAAIDTITVVNDGCGGLVVAAVQAAPGDFVPAVSAFTVPAASSYALPVTYTPGSAGTAIGTVTLVSNDPARPVLTVSVSGNGVEPAVAGISPSALAVDLRAGELETRALTLTNSGAGDLVYTVATENGIPVGKVGATAAGGVPVPPGKSSPRSGDFQPELAVDTKAGPVSMRPGGFADNLTVLREPVLTAARPSLTSGSADLQVMLLGSGDLAELQAALSAFSDLAAVDIFAADVATPTLAELAAYNVVMLVNNYAFLDPVTVGDRLADYVDLGGGVIQTEASFVAGYNIEGRFMDDNYAVFRLGTGPVGSASLGAYDRLHPIMDGVTAAQCLLTSNTNLVPGAVWVADWDNGRTLVATNGNQVVGVNVFAAQPGKWTGDVPLLLHNAVQWLASRIPWLDVTPMTGTVPPGGSVDLAVTFNAAGTAQGDLHALLKVNTNDPAQPVLAVPVDLTVSAAPVTVDVALRAGPLSDLENTLGMVDGATDGYDGLFDLPEPPPAPSNYLVGYFHHPEWNSPLGERFATDMRQPYDPTSDMKSWSFVVETDLSDSVTVVFAPSFAADTGWELWLRDEATGAMRNLFPALSYTYAPTGGPHRFTIYLGRVVPPLYPAARQIDSGWSLLGVPLEPSPGAATWTDVVLSAAPAPAYLYDFQGTEGYAAVPGGDPVGQGQGVWLATSGGYSWTMAGTQDTGTIEVTTMVGWNLLGYPLWVSGDLTGVSVQYGGQQYRWLDAVFLDLVSPFVYDYEDSTGTYLPVSQLEPWHGYWLAAQVSGVGLQFNYRSMLGLAASPAADGGVLAPRLPDLVETVAASKSGEAIKASTVGWQLNISLAEGGDQVAIGRTASGTTGFDASFDLPVPPAAPSGDPQTTLVIQHPEWSLATGAQFYSDLIDLETEPHAWPLSVRTPEPGPVTLRWDPNALPDGVDLQVYLPAENRVAVMSARAEGRVTVAVGTEPCAVWFRTPDSLSDVPFNMAGLQLRNVPNPFNPLTEFRFNLPREAAAEIRVFDLRGAVVRRISGGMLAAGPAKLRWSGHDSEGRQVASGVYFYRLYLDGQREGATLKMTLVK